MNCNLEWLTHWFDTFNLSYFEGSLPRPKLSLSRSRTRLGSMSCRRKMTWRGVRFTDFAIHISNYYDQSERDFQNVLLHEMIHYAIAYKGLKDTAPHGVVFKGMMEKLNKTYGWNIQVMCKTKNMQVAEANKKERDFLVLALTLTTDEQMLSVINPQYAQNIEKHLMGIREVRDFAWFVSRDEYFRAFPQVRSLRGKKVTKDVYNKMINQHQITNRIANLLK